MTVSNVWSGAITSSSAWVRGKVVGSAVRLAVSESPLLASPTWFGPVSPTAQEIVSIEATGLTPATQYYYALETNGTLQTGMSGKFRTFGTLGSPYSFRFAAWSCAGNSGVEYPGTVPRTSNSPVHATVADNRNPQFVVMTGDLHYRDIGSGVHDSGPPYYTAFRQAYDDVLANSNQSYLWRNVPIVYVWDDHDYGPNNSDKNSPSRLESRTVYRERVPHYPLATSTNPDGGIWHTFVCGRVRFVVTDIRSERSPQAATDNEDKLMLGWEQEQWFLQVLGNANEPLICWVNTVPWIAAQTNGADHWGGYTTERQRIANFINSVPGLSDRLFMISGDMHGLAIDNGSNNQWGGFPVYQFAAMDATPSTKGGPYSEGTQVLYRQYGIVDVDDQGDRIVVTGTGYRENTVWKSYSFEVPATPPGLLASIPKIPNLKNIRAHDGSEVKIWSMEHGGY